MKHSRFASATCPTCHTLFERLPVDGDEDGHARVALEVKPCATCGVMLCACCEQFACDGCGQAHCTEHVVLVPDGTPSPLKCCAACAAECEPLVALPACAWCDLAIRAEQGTVQRSGDVFHTPCFNELQAWTRGESAAFDDAQSFPRHADAAFPARRQPARELLRIVARRAERA